MADGRSLHPDALPNYQNAEIAREKLEGYALNPNHEAPRSGGSSGKDKARVFKTALGFDQSNWKILEQKIFGELPYNKAVLITKLSLRLSGITGARRIVSICRYLE